MHTHRAWPVNVYVVGSGLAIDSITIMWPIGRCICSMCYLPQVDFIKFWNINHVSFKSMWGIWSVKGLLRVSIMWELLK